MSYRITKTNKRTNRRKTNKRTNRRKTNKRTNRRKTNKRRRQSGGNFNPKQISELKNELIEIGFTDPELSTVINKFNDISQIQGKKFSWFINFIIENYNPEYNDDISKDKETNKRNLLDWIDEHYENQVEKVETDSEFTTSSFEE
jgi:hypothetical protein